MRSPAIAGIARAALPSTATGQAMTLLLVFGAVSPVAVQSFNVDLDMVGSTPEKGGGAPSNTFGAAAGQPGEWNSILPTSSGPLSLFDLNGDVTSVTMSVSSPDGFDGFAFNNPANTGDFALLFNDAASIGSLFDGGTRTHTFNGLMDGLYAVYTYGTPPPGTAGELHVTIPGSNEGTLMTSGAMTPNTFELGVTHVIHTIEVVGGTFTIELINEPGTAPAYVNGFQLVIIPAPGTLALLLLVPLTGNRRRREVASSTPAPHVMA